MNTIPTAPFTPFPLKLTSSAGSGRRTVEVIAVAVIAVVTAQIDQARQNAARVTTPSLMRLTLRPDRSGNVTALPGRKELGRLAGQDGVGQRHA